MEQRSMYFFWKQLKVIKKKCVLAFKEAIVTEKKDSVNLIEWSDLIFDFFYILKPKYLETLLSVNEKKTIFATLNKRIKSKSKYK